MKTFIQIRNPRSREDCLAVVQLTASNFAAEVRGAGQTPEQYIDIETDELYSNIELWPQIGIAKHSLAFAFCDAALHQSYDDDLLTASTALL